MRRSTAALAAAFIAALTSRHDSAQAQGTLRVGMTSVDVPTTGGIPNNGGEGYRFLGFPAYDALINWELARRITTTSPMSGPGSPTKWWFDEKDQTKWIFKLRHGVKFHDGTPLNVDAVMFNLRPHLRREGAAVRCTRLPDRALAAFDGRPLGEDR